MQKLGFYTVLLDYTVGAFTSPDVIFTFKITHGHTPDVCMYVLRKPADTTNKILLQFLALLSNF